MPPIFGLPAPQMLPKVLLTVYPEEPQKTIQKQTMENLGTILKALCLELTRTHRKRYRAETRQNLESFQTPQKYALDNFGV